jgi:hypothetical protein
VWSTYPEYHESTTCMSSGTTWANGVSHGCVPSEAAHQESARQWETVLELRCAGSSEEAGCSLLSWKRGGRVLTAVLEEGRQGAHCCLGSGEAGCSLLSWKRGGRVLTAVLEGDPDLGSARVLAATSVRHGAALDQGADHGVVLSTGRGE